MKRSGILHPRLSSLIASLGHTDTFVVADAGLPIPAGVERVDLALVLGIPRFEDVLQAILADVVIEEAFIAVEAAHSPAGPLLEARLPGATRVSHEDLKRACRDARFVVRTGSAVPYANAILRCGVPF